MSSFGVSFQNFMVLYEGLFFKFAGSVFWYFIYSKEIVGKIEFCLIILVKVDKDKQMVCIDEEMEVGKQLGSVTNF